MVSNKQLRRQITKERKKVEHIRLQKELYQLKHKKFCNFAGKVDRTVTGLAKGGFNLIKKGANNASRNAKRDDAIQKEVKRKKVVNSQSDMDYLMKV